MPRDDDDREREREGSTPQRQPKRQKIFRACTACVASKTRCEDVTPAGCSLCRRRNKTCSLAAVAGAFESTKESAAVATPSRSPAWHEVPQMPPLPPFSHTHHSTHASAHPTPPAMPLHPTPPGHPIPSPAAAHHLMSHVHTNHGSPLYPNEADDLRHRLAEAERRVERTENALAELTVRVRQQQDHLQHRVDHRPHHPPIDYLDADNLQVAGPLRLATMLLTSLDETMFSIASTKVFPDPVGTVISSGQAELAWHRFKARICQILPLPPFLAVSTPVPSHPFVLLAALHHSAESLDEGQRRGVARMVHASLMLAMAGSASIDVVLALLILSLAPPLPDDGSQSVPVTPTAYRLASLAYSMGQGLAMEARAGAVLASSGDLDDEPWAEALWTLQLWCAVSNRYTLLSLMNATSTPPPQLLAPRLPILSRDNLEVCNVHLRAESEVCGIFRPFVTRLTKLEHVASWPLVDLEDLQHEWEDACAQVRIFCTRNDRPPTVQNDAVCVEFTLGVRIAALTMHIPSPLREARETALNCLNHFPNAMKDMLDMLQPSSGARYRDPATTPEYVIILLATALVFFRRSVQFVAAAYPHVQLVEPTRLDAAEAKLRPLGRAARFILDESNRLLETLYTSSVWPKPQRPENGGGGGGGGNGSVSSGVGQTPRDQELYGAIAPQIWDMFDYGLLYPDIMMMGQGVA